MTIKYDPVMLEALPKLVWKDVSDPDGGVIMFESHCPILDMHYTFMGDGLGDELGSDFYSEEYESNESEGGFCNLTYEEAVAYFENERRTEITRVLKAAERFRQEISSPTKKEIG